MIPINELRVNNLVYYGGQVLPVLAIDSEMTLDWQTGEVWKGSVSLPQIVEGRRISTLGVWVNKLMPVEMSGYWLEQFGGINNGQDVFHFDDGAWTVVHYGGIYDGHDVLNFNDGAWTVIKQPDKFIYRDKKHKEIKTVHQFQNLYFAFNEKEIERIKTKKI